MASIVIPTTQVADTGTGATMEPYRLDGDLAVYREQSPTGAAAMLQFKRTEPKATKDYAGAMKGENRFTRQFADSTGKLWPAVVRIESSVPAFMTDAARAAFIKEAIMVNSLQASQDVLSKLAVPQV